MLSPYVKLHKNCSLCQKLLSGSSDPDFLFESHQHMCFKSPFAQKWPGALMPVYKKHICEQMNIFSADLPESLYSLVAFERALKDVTRCQKINFVKFGNVTEHLHWHIIPRYSNEIFPQKCSWELTEQGKEQLYEEGKVPFATEEENQLLYQRLIQSCGQMLAYEDPPYFGCALFLRPAKKERYPQVLSMDVESLLTQVRKEPAEWEGLLMQRNYFDYAWDVVGGNAEAGEFPEQTMLREVKEELGWDIKEYKEVCRQWRRSNIKGFVYIAIPAEQTYVADNPPRLFSDEVKDVKYFNLQHILQDHSFADSVRGRVRAFLGGWSDFVSTD